MFRNPHSLASRLATLLLVGGPATCLAGDSLYKALSEGNVDFYLRYRYENVDDELAGSGYANTVRTALGYKTGLFHGFGAYVQFEDVRDLSGDDTYNVPGVTPANPGRPVIADPSGTEVQQAYLRYRGVPKSTLSLGRLGLTHRQAPFHRFLGNVLWRQNWQSYDGFRFESDYLPATKLDYAYLIKANRIFGPDSTFGTYDMNSHVFRAEYSGLPIGVLEPYFYLLDFDGATGSANQQATFGSTATTGLRLQGEHPFVTSPYKLLYTAEFAWQGDYAENTNDIDHLYYVVEGGISRSFSGTPLQAITLKGTLEMQEGDGRTAFATPLGTNHAFGGWADKFLLTPRDGLRDIAATLAVKAWDATFLAIYHDFHSDNLDYAYGSEIDLQVTRKFMKNYLVLLKYARYDADDNATNLARRAANGRADADRDIFWASVEVEF